MDLKELIAQNIVDKELLKGYMVSFGIEDINLIDTEAFFDWCCRQTELRKFYAEVLGKEIIDKQGDYSLLDKIELTEDENAPSVITPSLEKIGYSNCRLMTFDALPTAYKGFELARVGLLYAQLPVQNINAVVKTISPIPMTYGTQVAIGDYGFNDDKDKSKKRKVLNRVAKDLVGGCNRIKMQASDTYCEIIVSKPNFKLQNTLSERIDGITLEQYATEKQLVKKPRR